MYEAIRQHIPFLRGHAEALAENPVAADDLLRETLLRALAKSHQVGPRTDLRAWLFILMHNHHAAGCSQTRYGTRGEIPDDDDVEGDAASALPEAPARVERALVLLPEAHRRLMALIAGETDAEAAANAPVPSPIDRMSAVPRRRLGGAERVRTARRSSQRVLARPRRTS